MQAGKTRILFASRKVCGNHQLLLWVRRWLFLFFVSLREEEKNTTFCRIFLKVNQFWPRKNIWEIIFLELRGAV